MCEYECESVCVCEGVSAGVTVRVCVYHHLIIMEIPGEQWPFRCESIFFNQVVLSVLPVYFPPDDILKMTNFWHFESKVM